MDSTTQQNQLEIVGALAASLADRMLMERLTRGALPLENANRLWTASLLLEEHRWPIPDIVADVLAEVRHVEPALDRDAVAYGPESDTVPAAQDDAAEPRTGRLIRLLRPFRQTPPA